MKSNAKDWPRAAGFPRICDPAATELDLSARKLRVITTQTVEGLTDYRGLKTLDLSLNGIGRITGLETMLQLTTLNLSQNVIKSIEGLKTLTLLQTLDLSDNKIQELPSKELSPLSSLRTLLLSRNYVDDLEEVRHLSVLPSLLTLYLEGNPIAKSRDLLLFVAFHLPGLKQLDAVVFTTDHRQAALKVYSKTRADLFLVRENLVSYRKKISELQDTRQDLLAEGALVQAQLSALDVDYKLVVESLERCKEEKKDVERMMACTPGDQLHAKKNLLAEGISRAEILRDEAENLSMRLQTAKVDIQTKEHQLEVVRKRLRNRGAVSPADDFLSAEEQQLVTELKEMKLATQALSREHHQKLRDMQEAMHKIESLDQEIQEVKAGTVSWERTFDEETAQYLPVRLTELTEEIKQLTAKGDQIKAKNVQILVHKTELDRKLERSELALAELKEKVRDNEVYAETGQSPPRQRPVMHQYASQELQAWESLKALWALVSDSDLEIDFSNLPASVIKWTELFLQHYEAKSKESEFSISTARRLGDAQSSCLRSEMKEMELELSHWRTEAESIPGLQSTVNSLEQQLADSQKQISELKCEASTLRGTVRAKDERIEQLEHRELMLDEMHSTMVRSVEEMTEINESLTRELEKYQREPIKSELAALRAELEAAKEELKTVNAQWAETKARIADGSSALDKAKLELAETQAKVKTVEEDLGLFMTLKHRKEEVQRADSAVRAVASTLQIEQDSVPALVVQISRKLQELRLSQENYTRFQKEQKDLADKYERKFAQLKSAREKFALDQTNFRKSQKAIIDKLQQEKNSVEKHCKSLRQEADRLSETLDSKREQLTALKHQIAAAQRSLVSIQSDARSGGRITSRDLQAPGDRSFVVLRSSPDIGFVSPCPKTHRKHSSMAVVNCPTEEDRCSSVQTDRMYRASPIRRGSVSRVDESRVVTQSSDCQSHSRIDSVVQIEDDLQALRAQLQSFSAQNDPLPRQLTI